MNNIKDSLKGKTLFARIGKLLFHIENGCEAAARNGKDYCQISFSPTGNESFAELLHGEWKDKYARAYEQRNMYSNDRSYEEFLNEVRNAVAQYTGLDVRNDVSYKRNLYEQVWWFSWK